MSTQSDTKDGPYVLLVEGRDHGQACSDFETLEAAKAAIRGWYGFTTPLFKPIEGGYHVTTKTGVKIGVLSTY